MPTLAKQSKRAKLGSVPKAVQVGGECKDGPLVVVMEEGGRGGEEGKPRPTSLSKAVADC